MQRKDLDASGFLLSNEQKSHWTPMQIGEWLGFVINTMSMHFSIPEKKVNKLKNSLNSAISDGYCSAVFNGYRIQSSPSSCTILFSDASELGFGGYAACWLVPWYAEYGVAMTLTKVLLIANLRLYTMFCFLMLTSCRVRA